MLVIKRFNPYKVVESDFGVDTTKKDESLQIKPSKKRRLSKESVKEFISKLDDIKNERSDGDEDKIIKEITQEDKDDRTKHQLIQIPPTNRKKWPQKPCVYCRKNKVRRDTRYICSSCKTALCKDCFSNYHANIKKYILC